MTHEDVVKVMEMVIARENIRDQIIDIVRIFYPEEELRNLPGISTTSELLDYIRLAGKYSLFDTFATNIELKHVQKQLQEAESN